MKKNLVAVSLKYPQDVEAPLITAKGTGVFAEKMIEIARENDIPVVENDIAASILSMKEIGQCIPRSAWQAVAGVFAYLASAEFEK